MTLFTCALAPHSDWRKVATFEIEVSLTQILRLVVEIENLRIVEILAPTIRTRNDLEVIIAADSTATSFYLGVIVNDEHHQSLYLRENNLTTD